MPFPNILLALFSADFFFVVIHILHTIPSEIFPFLRNDAFSITRGLGLAESFQYVKEFWIALVFFLLVIRFRKLPFISWGFFFSFLLFDDMLSIHEKLGEKAGVLFAQWPILQRFENLQAEDFGELAVSGLFGLFFLSLIAVAYFRGDRVTRSNFHVLFVMFAGLIVFRVGFDILDRFINERILIEFFKLLEDGGEMFAMSLICWYAYSLYERGGLSKGLNQIVEVET